MLINMLYFIYFILESIRSYDGALLTFVFILVIYCLLLTICQYLNALIVTPVTNGPSVKWKNVIFWIFFDFSFVSKPYGSMNFVCCYTPIIHTHDIKHFLLKPFCSSSLMFQHNASASLQLLWECFSTLVYHPFVLALLSMHQKWSHS